jgi:hypothetical protein
MNHTIRQQTRLRSPLLQRAERGLEHKRGAYIIVAVCFVACVLIVAYSALGGAV